MEENKKIERKRGIMENREEVKRSRSADEGQ